MSNYVAIIEDAGPDTAIGVWFPDISGCFSAGDTLDEAIVNASAALAGHLAVLRANGLPIPAARTLTALKADPDVADEIMRYMVAVITPAASRVAAE